MLQQIKNLIPEKVKKRIKVEINRGHACICPICDYKAKKWALIGNDFPVLYEKKVIGGGRRHAGCFNCGSTDRERLVFLYLKNHLKLFETKKHFKILDIAPDLCLTEKLYAHGFSEYLCGDLYTEGYQYPNYVHTMDVTEIPYFDNYFDLIICNHVFEHVPDDLKAMREIYRVLKPGMKAILMVPFSMNSEKTFEDSSIQTKADREKYYGQKDHIRLYGKDYFERLKSAGFEVELKNISADYPQYGLHPDEDLIFGVKRI